MWQFVLGFACGVVGTIAWLASDPEGPFSGKRW